MNNSTDIVLFAVNTVNIVSLIYFLWKKNLSKIDNYNKYYDILDKLNIGDKFNKILKSEIYYLLIQKSTGNFNNEKKHDNLLNWISKNQAIVRLSSLKILKNYLVQKDDDFEISFTKNQKRKYYWSFLLFSITILLGYFIFAQTMFFPGTIPHDEIVTRIIFSIMAFGLGLVGLYYYTTPYMVAKRIKVDLERDNN